MSDWAMREFAEDDGYGRWPKHALGRHRPHRCKANVMNVINDQQELVRRYLELLRRRATGQPDGPDGPAWADAEDAFTEVAKSYGRRHRIDVETWIAVRVPADVLRRAGFRLPDPSEPESTRNGPR